jgi:uncharacterized membrane protein YjjP (DUF1212 family)
MIETLIGFAIGYVAGTQSGRDGLQKARESLDAIRQSPEVKQMILAGVTVAGGAVRQVLGGGAGAALTGAVEALARKATDAVTDTRQAA